MAGSVTDETRTDRASDIADAIIRAVVEHRLPPGTRLGEDDLGATFGVSRTIVRAALRMLARDAIVTIRPNRGAAIASPSVAEARQVFHARRVIETALIREAAAMVQAGDIATLRLHLAEEDRALRDGDRPAAIRLSGDFHLRIAAIPKQEVLAAFLRELISRSALVIALYGRTGASQCGTHDHADLVDALRARDGERAARLMAEHLSHVEGDLDLQIAVQPGVDLRTVLRG